MIKIINSKKYDTSTSEYLGDHQYSIPGNTKYTYEALYRTKGGEFFLYAEGGPFSIYGKAVDDFWKRGDETIVPLTYGDAQKWTEKNLSGEDYESIFGKVEEDNTKKLIPMMIGIEAAEKLTRYADRSGKKRAEIVEDLLMSLDV